MSARITSFSHIEVLVTLTQLNSNLAHEMQKERGIDAHENIFIFRVAAATGNFMRKTAEEQRALARTLQDQAERFVL